MVIIWDENYRYAAVWPGVGGVLLSVAVKRGTDPTEVWFRASFDKGETWNEPVQVGTLPSGSRALIWQDAHGVLWVTSAPSRRWKSKNLGRTWASA